MLCEECQFIFVLSIHTHHSFIYISTLLCPLWMLFSRSPTLRSRICWSIQPIKISFVRKIVILIRIPQLSFSLHPLPSSGFSSMLCYLSLEMIPSKHEKRISHTHRVLAITKNIISMCRSIIKYFNKKRHDTIDITDTMQVFDNCILYYTVHIVQRAHTHTYI